MDDETTVEIAEGVDGVEAGPPADTSPPADGSSDGPAAVTPPGRSPLAVGMLVVSGLLVIAAVVFGVLGAQAQSEASDEQDKAAAAVERRHNSSDEERQLTEEQDALEEQVTALPDRYDAIGDAMGGLSDAHDRYVDLLIQSVDLYNAGDTPGSVNVLTANGGAALNDLKAKQTATQDSITAAEDALQSIQEGLG